MQEDRLLRLERLARIRESGGLTEEEFQRLKESIRNAEESHATPSLRTETDEETYRRQKRLSEIAQRSTAEEDRERYRANTQIVRARQKLEAPKSAYLAFFGAMLFGGFSCGEPLSRPLKLKYLLQTA